MRIQLRAPARLCGFLLLLVAAVSASAADAPPTPAYDGKPGTKAGQQCVNPKDGAVMVWVPAGNFLMGSTDADKLASGHEKPQHTVYLDGYWAYQCEVTIDQYAAYCEATKHAMPEEPEYGWRDRCPVVNVTWQDAVDYAAWAVAALPTEAQWEKAARGADGRLYPWGNEWDRAKCCNSVDQNTSRPKPVGSFPAGTSPYGCLDMAGNVWEWCKDVYNEDYYTISPERNPTGPKFGKERVLRGGSWYFVIPYYFRCAYRRYITPTNRSVYYGFRCVVSPPGQ